MTNIKVEVPTEEKVANPYRGGYDYKLVNREYSIKVYNDTGLDECEKLCMRQTGMTPVAYQEKYQQAWNE